MMVLDTLTGSNVDFWCLLKAVLRDCAISWISSCIVLLKFIEMYKV